MNGIAPARKFCRYGIIFNRDYWNGTGALDAVLLLPMWPFWKVFS
jgi:hypothetical protein